jgi:hypothetical protein
MITQEKMRKSWVEGRAAFLRLIGSIDHLTPAEPGPVIEPKWWLEMMETDRAIRNIMERNLENDKPPALIDRTERAK